MNRTRLRTEVWTRVRRRSEDVMWQGFAASMYYGSMLLVGAKVTRIDEGGRHLLSGTTPVIVAANHQSHADAGVISMSLPPGRRRRIRLVGSQQMVSLWAHSSSWKTRIWHRLLTTMLFKSYRVIVVRGALTRSEAVSVMAQAFNDGSTIVIFPEGSQAKDGVLQTLRSGVADLALATKGVIVPIRIDGTRGAMPSKQRLRPRPHITARIRPPITARVGESAEQLLTRLAASIGPDPVQGEPDPVEGTTLPRQSG